MKTKKQTYKYSGILKLEQGGELKKLRIAYHTFGKPKSKKTIWICHALTANSDPSQWWEGIVGKGKLYDPEKYFIVCANILGSPYGTTAPLSINPENKQRYYRDFPIITIRDMVQAHILLRKHLNIKTIHTVIGGSIGSFQALEWAIMEPKRIKNLVVIAGSATTTPWMTAINETQRMAIKTDVSYYNDKDTGGLTGLKTARAIGLLSYRNEKIYNKTQKNQTFKKHPAISYQNYQGEKLARRFNAYSYYSLSLSFDSHNVGRNRKGIAKALSKIKAKTLIIGITSDLLFPIKQQKLMHKHIQHSKLKMINSIYGHDGFLIETKKITKIIKKFYQK